MYINFIGYSEPCKVHKPKQSQMFQLRRMNALTYEQARIMTKLARDEPVSPKSLEILNKVF
jgi:hypothetical protein